MRFYSQQLGVLIGATAMVVAQPLTRVASAQLQDVKLQATQQGFALTLETDRQERPQIFTIKRDNVLVADLTDTQLALEDGEQIRQSNPFPGVKFLTISQVQPDTVRVVVRGTQSAPEAKIQSVKNGQVTLNFMVEGGGGEIAQPSSQSEQIFSQDANPTAEQAESEVRFPNSDPPSSPGLEPTLPRATAPPVGDIAVSTIDVSPSVIELGTDTRVPRLVLREAPVREVLTLLARSANVNLVFEEGGAAGNPISVDLENESVQDAFNSILQLSGLQANRKGNTIFVSADLPRTAQNLVTRSFRLNQASAGNVAAYLRSLGGGSENALLTDISVVTDERLNSVTVTTPDPRQMQIAMDFIRQLDARTRQVSVNVKILDVNLSNTQDFNTSFSFGIADTFFRVSGGQIDVSFDNLAPAVPGFNGPNGLSRPLRPLGDDIEDDQLFPNRFIAELESSIQTGNSKILTDPTLLIQEGETAEVQLTQEVFAGTEVEFREVGDNVVQVQTLIIEDAGLTLSIDVQRIDDNGFINLNIQPTVSSIGGSQIVETAGEGGVAQNEISLLQERTLDTGQVRLRDGQTLILAGIIQDQDRTTVNKVPILGDLPILGTLFRTTTTDRDRNEVIVLVTPTILKDSLGTSGYTTNYQPSPAAREMLEDRGYPLPQQRQRR